MSRDWGLGDTGVRNLLGMLLMTLGLSEACRFAPPLLWIQALNRRREMAANELEIRDQNQFISISRQDTKDENGNVLSRHCSFSSLSLSIILLFSF